MVRWSVLGCVRMGSRLSRGGFLPLCLILAGVLLDAARCGWRGVGVGAGSGGFGATFEHWQGLETLWSVV